MRITLGPTDQLEPISEGFGQIWVGRTSTGIEIVAVIAVVGCKPEDHESFARESVAGGMGFELLQPAAIDLPDRLPRFTDTDGRDLALPPFGLPPGSAIGSRRP